MTPRTTDLRIAAAAVAAAATTYVARQGVPAWDSDLFRQINVLPDWVARVTWVPMQAGALGAPLSVAAVLALRGRRHKAATVAMTGLATWVAAKGVKEVADRPRPGQHINSAKLRFGSADKGLGFPSGHAAVSVALVISCTEPGSPARLVGTGLAMVVGVSRIHVGAHYPLDVVGGWSLGWLAGGLLDRLTPNVTFHRRLFTGA